MKGKENRAIGIIGLGRMGRCLVKGLQSHPGAGNDNLRFTTHHEHTTRAVEKELGVSPCKSNRELVETCSTIVIAVKPQNMGEVLKEIGSCSVQGKTFISIAASVTTDMISDRLKRGAHIVRAMPNTPAFVGFGITAACPGTHCGEVDWERVKQVFEPVGKLVRVDEKHMDAVTGLSGCGPAYIYVVLESLTDAGIKVGLPRDLASSLAAHTLQGAARMLLDTQKHPAALKDEVTTPAGCTIDGLLELEEGKLRVTLIKAVVRATERAQALAKLVKL